MLVAEIDQLAQGGTHFRLCVVLHPDGTVAVTKVFIQTEPKWKRLKFRRNENWQLLLIRC